MSERCICVDYLNNNPDPVPNPDCPIHGAGFALLSGQPMSDERTPRTDAYAPHQARRDSGVALNAVVGGS